MVGSPLATLTGWALFVALVLLLGGVGARLVVLPRIGRARSAEKASLADGPPGSLPVVPSIASALAESAARVGLAGAALLPLALGLVFVRQLLEFRDPFVPWQEDAHLLLFGTAWGDVWLAAGAVSLVSAAGFVLAARGRRAGWWLGAPAALALGVYPALTGHASGTGPLRWLTIPADVLHVWAAGFWVGGLAFVLYADRRVRRLARAGQRALHEDADAVDAAGAEANHRTGRPGAWRAVNPVNSEALAGAVGPGLPGADPATLHAEAGPLSLLVPAFSPLAVACVATLVLTGAFAAWVHLPAPLAPLSDLYGRTLAMKLLLALVAFALGATNWRRLTPRLEEAGGDAALRRTALIELGVAQLVLFVTAMLVRTAP